MRILSGEHEYYFDGTRLFELVLLKNANLTSRVFDIAIFKKQ